MATISGVTGTLAHGSSVTITGSGFGTKATAAPYVWDDCEGTNPSAKWTNAYPYAAGHPYDLHYTTPAALGRGVALPFNRGTKYMAGCHRQSSPSSGTYVGVGFNYTKDFTKPTYLNFWWRVDPAWTDDGDDQNFKLWHVNNDSDAYHGGQYQYFEVINGTFTGAGSGSISMDVINSGFGFNGNMWGTVTPAPNPATGWHKWEYFITWGGNGAGRFMVRVNGVLVFDSGVCATDTASGTARAELIGNFARAKSVNNYRYFKNLYVDRTYQRVILGNASTLSACTILEPQIPTAWSDTEITATLNLGPIADDATAYLFVVDSSNTPSAGYQITLGEESGGGDPGGGDPPDSAVRIFIPRSGLL